MKFLFSHRNFPAQFRHLLLELAKDDENEIVFITGTQNKINIEGVKKYTYKLKRTVPKNCHRYLQSYEESVIHGQSAAEVAIALRENGFIPDVIYAHAWGNSMFFKDVFPNTPLINYCEWFYKPDSPDIIFDNKKMSDDLKARNRCKSAQLALDMLACNKGICPTHWQKEQFPKEFLPKIEVLHDGIDTDYFKPNSDTVFRVPNSDVILTTDDEVLTYATRGMEPYRGFPQFMEAAAELIKHRPNLHVVVGGEDRVCYGEKPLNGTYKELMLKKLDLDLSRVHFTGGLPYEEYKKILQISSAHVYLTYPFVLSWSLLEAMSCGCCIVASDTSPVKEVVQDGYNGILTDFFDKTELVEKINFVLDNPNDVATLRKNARETVVKSYDLKKLLPKHIELIKNIISHSI